MEHDGGGWEQRRECGDGTEMTQAEARGGMRAERVGWLLPGINEEAVEAAQIGEEERRPSALYVAA